MQAQRKEMRERELDILRTIIGTVSEMFNPFDGENKVHGERAAAEFKAEMEKKGLKRDSMRIIISIEFEGRSYGVRFKGPTLGSYGRL